jgi:hypothetical protein
MIKKVNGININGSVFGTMSQSISAPSIGNFYSYTELPSTNWYVIGSSRFERQWLTTGDLINFRSSLTQTINFEYTYEIGLFWATQSIATFSDGSINTVNGPTQLGYYQTPGDLRYIPFNRSIYMDTSSSFSVISSTASLITDSGDIASFRTSVTIPSGDGYFIIAAYISVFDDPGRFSDSIRLHYMTFEPIYATRPSPFPSNPRNKNNILITKNSVGSNTDVTAGFVTNGSSVTGTTALTIVNSINMTGFVVDGSLFRIETRCYKTGGVIGGYSIRYYFNTSVSLTGATLMATRGVSPGNNWHYYTRRVFVPKADGSGSGTEIINVNTGYFSEYSATQIPSLSTLPLNWNSNPCYIICVVNLSSASDTFNCDYMSIVTY